MTSTDDLLVATCRTMIRTILSCLDNATKGTIYKIGLMPDLTAVRVLSGIRKTGSDELEWGLPADSEYNFPGKKWEMYRDQPGRPLEAMGWCVEKQKSWTADNPLEDPRSVRKQISGIPEDEFHMEPVLVRKLSLYGHYQKLRYPFDWQGNPIWADSEYVVSAVVKIHFRPGTLKAGDRSTIAVRNLARSLGSELLSLWFREKLYYAGKEFARQRLQSCEILAHELRNTLIKLGFVFPAINAQIGILRETWEKLLKDHLPELEWKEPLLEKLCGELDRKLPELDSSNGLREIAQKLLNEQKELEILHLSPFQEREWLKKKIAPRWNMLLTATDLWESGQITALLALLEKTFSTGLSFVPSSDIDGLPVEFLARWSKLAYVQITSANLVRLDEVILLVEEPAMPVSHKEQMLRVLKSLRAIVQTIQEVEGKTNSILQSLRFGNRVEDEYGFGSDVLGLEYDEKIGVGVFE